MNDKLKGYIYASLSAICYGTIPLFSFPALHRGVDVHSLLFYRFLFASLIMGIWLCVGKDSLKLRAREFAYVVVAGILFAFSAKFLFLSYNYMTSGIATTIQFFYPVFVILIMSALFKDKPPFLSVFAMILSLVGVSLLSFTGKENLSGFPGIIYGMISSLSYAIYIVFVNHSSLKSVKSPVLTFYTLIVTAFYFMAEALCETNLVPIRFNFPFLSILFLSLLSTSFSCIFLISAVHYIGSTHASLMGTLEPVTAVILGILVFGEIFTPLMALGMAIILSSVILIILSGTLKLKFNFFRKSKSHYSKGK